MNDAAAYPIITLADVSVRFGEREVLSHIDLTVNHGDFIAITGPNGGGKTTLLRVMLKLLKPTTGTVTYADAHSHAIDSLPIGYLPQKNMIDSSFPVSVRDVIESGLLRGKGLLQRLTAADHRKATEMIDRLGLSELAGNTLGTLSGGQMQRALLGRALISQPQVIVLDEPLSYVDKRFEKQIYDTIAQIAPSTTIILVSHEMTAIAPMANRHIIIDRTLHDCHAHHHFVFSECD